MKITKIYAFMINMYSVNNISALGFCHRGLKYKHSVFFGPIINKKEANILSPTYPFQFQVFFVCELSRDLVVLCDTKLHEE